MEKGKFAFEDLEVWQKAVEFAEEVIDIAEQTDTKRRHYRLIEQLESASTSVALNIAEGKGRYSKKEFIQFLYISRGSLYETITLLIIFYKKTWISSEQLSVIKERGERIAKMLSSLINYIKKSI
ncbi:MAG: four helix bundle protein [Candidatus Omnitrophica bacterium]|nr:four helix bundle protein [Candidatus Omnitrophota bacterium]MBU4479601.1 four helix bundle protein [Candidatus Omnitrophota bacterium]MCG2703441.1 four helix bundle protein [Candidatus Omnitrophota bacterium]MCG2711403.1 four helix bundle protein [Candidatus Omnitrophota bacterium]